MNTMKKQIITYFQIITEESALRGDFAKTGKLDIFNIDLNDDESPVDQAVNFLKKQNFFEASSSVFHDGIWYQTVDPDRDVKSGDEIYYTFHLNGFTEDEQKEVYNKLFNKGK